MLNKQKPKIKERKELPHDKLSIDLPNHNLHCQLNVSHYSHTHTLDGAKSEAPKKRCSNKRTETFLRVQSIAFAFYKDTLTWGLHGFSRCWLKISVHFEYRCGKLNYTQNEIKCCSVISQHCLFHPTATNLLFFFSFHSFIWVAHIFFFLQFL